MKSTSYVSLKSFINQLARKKIICYTTKLRLLPGLMTPLLLSRQHQQQQLHYSDNSNNDLLCFFSFLLFFLYFKFNVYSATIASHPKSKNNYKSLFYVRCISISLLLFTMFSSYFCRYYCYYCYCF